MYCLWVQQNSDIQICFCFSLGSTVYDRLYSALTNNALVKGIKQASPLAQTSCLEGFHSVLNQFAPKMIAYSYIGLYCRWDINLYLIKIFSQVPC